MSEHGRHTLSRVEVKYTDVLIGTGGGDVETRRVDLHLRRTERSQHLLSPWKRLHGNAGTDLDERPVLALRAFIQLLLLPVTDVEDPAGGRGEAHLHHLHQYTDQYTPEHITVNMRTQCCSRSDQQVAESHSYSL